MYAINFEFNGKKLSDYGMMICGIDGTFDGTFSSGADVVFTQTPNAIGKNFYLSGNYESPYQATFSICKNICMVNSNSDDIYLSPILVSSIQRWLCVKSSYKKFKLLGDSDYSDIYWNATFSSQQIVSGGKIIGLSLTMYADAPYAYRDSITNEFECSKNSTFKLIDMSDEVGYIQPDVEITFSEKGNFSLDNSMDNRIFKVNNCLKNEVITIDGIHEIISTSSSTHALTLYKDFNYFFPRIINSYTENANVFTPNLSCKIKITYSPIIKVGI